MARLAVHPELDPQAALAVASAEGLSGGIGDGGHAFGPFQLNNAGGVITGKFPGWSPTQINAWAWSPAGIDYALSGISHVAAGLRGGQAVSNIVSRFERPADPAGEIQRAIAAYGGHISGGQVPAGYTGAAGYTAGGSSGAAGATQPPSPLAARLASLIARTNSSLGLPSSGGLASLLAQRLST